jgi:DNA-binding protein Fis
MLKFDLHPRANVMRPMDRWSVRRIQCLILTGLCLGAWVPAAQALTARDIMQRVNDRDDGDRMTAETEMRLVDAQGNERVRRLKTYRRHAGKDTQSLMFFLAPADVKDTGFLTYDYDEAGKDDDQWLYLPALRRSKRIASGDKSGSFMGSDFNYSDMTKPFLDDYEFSLLGEEDVTGARAWRIEGVPKRPAVSESTGYSKAQLWVRQDNFVIVRSLRWVHKSTQTKRLEAKQLERIDGIWVSTTLEMVTLQGEKPLHTTVLRQLNTRLNQPLAADLFTLRRLEKGP